AEARGAGRQPLHRVPLGQQREEPARRHRSPGLELGRADQRRDVPRFPLHHPVTVEPAAVGVGSTRGACDGKLMVRSTKKAMAAAARSKTMATVNTPAQPTRGSANLAANGVQAAGSTANSTPQATKSRPMPKRMSCVLFRSGIRNTVGARKWAKKASAPPTSSRMSARKSNAFPAASADPMGTNTDA